MNVNQSNLNTTTNQVSFNFWYSKGSGVGHSGTNVINKGNSTYHALWPKTPFLANVFSAATTVPLLGHYVGSFKQDKTMEERNPDVRISFEIGSQTAQEIEDFMEASKKDISEEKKLYGLTPKTPVFLGFMKALAHPDAMRELHRDPISGLECDFLDDFLPTDLYERGQELTIGHCTTETEEIVKRMGIKPPKTLLPWGNSPDKLGKFLESAPGAKVERFEQPQSKPEDNFCAP